MRVSESVICVVFNRRIFFRFVTFLSECCLETTKIAEMCKGGRLTVRLKLKILDLYGRNLSVMAIKDRLLKEDSVRFSRTTIYSFLMRHTSFGILTRRRRTVNPASVKLKDLHHKFIDLWMDKNYELKASELQKRLFRDIRFESANFTNHNENVQIPWLEIAVKQQNLPDDKQEKQDVKLFILLIFLH